MRLKKLILQGFKSFADRTEFCFDAQITGIVGPNGCGKSNVVDAVKWVLGEQSAKSLRGDAMMDVIFNGSDARKAAGLAEVTLVFENIPDADGKRPLAQTTDEVAVARRLFRDGASEYQINQTTTRLKDVRELFLDTGVGVDAYSVIEQGRVAAMLDANPEERRIIFEEAAGISKFKARKKEAQRKLEKVDANLLRVNDVVQEVDRRLRSVKAQATKARTYQEYSTKLGELRLSFGLHEYHTHRVSQTETTQKLQEARFRLDDADGDLATSQNALALRREELESLQAVRQRLEFALVQARAQIHAAQQRQEFAHQQSEQVAEQLAGAEKEKSLAAAKLDEIVSSLAAQTAACEELTAQLDDHNRQIARRQADFSAGQQQQSDITQKIEKQKSIILDLMRKLAAAGSRLGAIEIELKNVAAQQVRLAGRRDQVAAELATLDAARTELTAKIEQISQILQQRQADLEIKRAAAEALGRQIAQVADMLGAAREHRSGLLSRRKLLEDLEARREGVSEGVQSVLRQRDTKYHFVRGLVADILRVDIEHALRIEAALDGQDQLLVTSDTAAALANRETLDEVEGRIGLLLTDRLNTPETDSYDWQKHNVPLRLAIDVANFDPADEPIARHLLGRTILVDDLDAALTLHKGGPPGYRFVTHSGQVLESDGILRCGPLAASMGLISRRSELVALTQQISEVDGRIQSLTAQLADRNTQARTLEDEIAGLQSDIYQTNSSRIQLTGNIAQNTDRQNALQREHSVLEKESASLADHAARAQTEETRLRAEHAALEQSQTESNARAAELSASLAAIGDSLRLLSEQLTDWRIQLGQVQEKQLSARQSLQRQTSARGELQEQIDRLARSADVLQSRQTELQREADTASRAEQTLQSSVQSDEQQSAACQGKIAALSAQVAELTTRVEAARSRRQEIEQEIHELDLAAGQITVRIEALVQRTAEELQLDLPARYAELTTDGATYQPAEMDWEKIAEEIKDLRDRIHRLGNVNVEAIGEQDELEQRRQFLATQVTDLTTSKTQLEQLIIDINTESGVRFEQTFNAVREHFQGMFRKLFGGGKADVYLETEIDPPKNAPPILDADGNPLPIQKIKVDILDAGIEIIARPPGKQPATISQLSGGEKTMVCVALLMSIFKSKPSPFCILDEVDAALDEANNQRFNMIVREFLDQSQFIVITHSKRTMQIADVLYGVTMQEQGVSRRVAVKFDQIDNQGRIAEHAAA